MPQDQELLVYKRYKYIRLTADILVFWLSDRMIGDLVLTPLPKDSKVVRNGFDSMGNFIITIESNEFEEVEVLHGEVPFFGDIHFKKERRTVASN